MILFHKVVQISAPPDGYRFFIRFTGIERGKGRSVGATFIDGYHLRFAMLANGLAKETQGGCGIPFGCQQEVDGLTYSIHRPVQIFPLAFDFDVGFVHAPTAAHWTFMPTKGLIQQGG